jgi:hypothetical protein
MADHRPRFKCRISGYVICNRIFSFSGTDNKISLQPLPEEEEN